MFLNHVLLDHKCFDGNFTFNTKELALLKELADALHPLEIAVKYLSKRNSTLIDAIKKLENQETSIAKNLANKLKDRIDFRRDSTLIHLIHYLQDPKYISKMKDFFGHKIRKTDITNLAISLFKRLFTNVETDVEMK